jgi:hypothetical protein
MLSSVYAACDASLHANALLGYIAAHMQCDETQARMH